MSKNSQRSLMYLCLTPLILIITGFVPESFDDKIQRIRNQYTILLEGFTIEPVEVVRGFGGEDSKVVPVTVEEGAISMGGTELGEEGTEGNIEGKIVEGPHSSDVLLHLLVSFSGDESLPGITMGVIHTDSFGKEKTNTLHWIETVGMKKNEKRQLDFKLEGIEFKEGDAFSVLLREVVPPEERSKYREFAEAGP